MICDHLHWVLQQKIEFLMLQYLSNLSLGSMMSATPGPGKTKSLERFYVGEIRDQIENQAGEGSAPDYF